MKKMIRLFAMASALVTLASCTLYHSEKTVQSDRGVPIAVLELSPSGLMLSGARTISTQIVTAKWEPVFADDTYLSWKSSDTSVVTVEDTNGSVCTLTLQGNGTAVVTATNYDGSVSASCLVQGVLSTVVPFEVENLSAQVFSTNAELSWTTPEKNAGFLKQTIISVHKSQADAESLSNPVSQVIVETAQAGTNYTAYVQNLEPSTEYYFAVRVENYNGNVSPVKVLHESTHELDDEPADDVQSLGVSMGSNYAELSWTVVDVDDVREIHLVTSSTAAEAVIPDEIIIPEISAAGSYTVTNLSQLTEYKFTVYTYDINYNKSQGASVSGKTKLAATNLVAAYDPEFKYSGFAQLSWTDPDGDFDSLKVTAVPESGEALSFEVEKGIESCSFEKLLVGIPYTFTVETLNHEDESLGSSSVTAYASKFLVRLYSRKNTGYLVPTSAGTLKTQDGNSAAYSFKWIRRPALDSSSTFTYTADNKNSGPAETFSMEAMNLEGKGSGLFFYITDVDKSVTSSSGAAITGGIIAPDSIPEMSLATLYKSACNSSTAGDGSMRFTKLTQSETDTTAVYYQIGGNGSGGIIYRTSAGSPGYNEWWWGMTVEDATESY